MARRGQRKQVISSEYKKSSVIYIRGFPIPLHYITPSLKFYPPALLNTVFFRKNINNHFNDNNINVSLNEMFNIYFVNCLMKCLNRKFLIVGQFLIDLSRQDYFIRINKNTNDISIYNYTNNMKYQYICENELKNLTFPPVDKKFETCNLYNWTEFFNYHSNRICEGTERINHYIQNLT